MEVSQGGGIRPIFKKKKGGEKKEGDWLYKEKKKPYEKKKRKGKSPVKFGGGVRKKF